MRRIFVRERAQTIVVAALLIPVLLGMTGMAIDVGSYAVERRELQNDADAIALAAAQSLPNQSNAEAAADDWAAKNSIDLADVDVTISGGTTSPQAEVVISRTHEFSFMRILGINDRSVGARAVAGKFSFGSGAGVVPWSITQETLDAAESGELVTVKYDSNGNPGQGNFGAIRIDGNGASDYEYAAMYGSNTRLCSVSMTGCTASACPGTFPSSCAETAPECDGPDCTPKTGNMTGPTRDAVDYREQYTSASCDTFDEVFTESSVRFNADGTLYVSAAWMGGRPQAPQPKPKTDTPTITPTRTTTPVPTNTAVATNTPAATWTPVPSNTAGPSPTGVPSSTPQSTSTPGPSATPGTSGRYSLNPNCNPWAGPGACPSGPSTVSCSRRVIIIPVIDEFGNGSSDPVEIQRFAILFLEGYDGSCTGSSCDIQARFVNANVTTGALAGAYDADAPIQFAKLIE